MGFFTRTAMDALMKTSHPEINRRQCWNLHPHRKPCTTCKDICPYGEEIFTRPNLVKDWDPCTDCGLCVSACRSGCIAPSPEQVQRDTAAADTDNDTIWIGCEKSSRKNTVVRSCICALSWEALAYLALNKKIVLDLTPCGQCENDLCAEQLRKELTRLVDFFGQPMFEARFSLAYEEKEYPYHVQELTRREMLEQVSHGSKSGTKKLLQMLPGLRSEEDSGVDFRLLLHQRTKQLKAAMETPLQYGYYMPKFTDNCFGCGRCEKACRANALKFEEMPNGQTRMVLTPWKCSECGVCMNVCSNKGFDGMKLYQLTTLGPVVLYKCTKTLCKQCGKPIAPDSAEGLCSVCRIKARTLKRQEEARQRAEQLKAERAAKAAEVWANIEENKRYTGTVKSLTSYGAFVDIGGVDGMVHISELSWSRIKHPSEVVSVGDTVEVYVISFDKEKKKISLGMKDRSQNPWEVFTGKYQPGDVANVRVVKLMTFGAFAEVVPGVDGLIHISQIADHRIDKPGDVLSEGQMVDVKIIDIDYDNKKVSLSIRALLEGGDEPAESEDVNEE